MPGSVPLGLEDRASINKTNKVLMEHIFMEAFSILDKRKTFSQESLKVVVICILYFFSSFPLNPSLPVLIQFVNILKGGKGL